MPTPTYKPLANVTLTSSATTVTFSGISQLYTDLILVGSNVTSSVTNEHMQFRLNGDASATYNWVTMKGDGGSTYAQGAENATEANFGTFVVPSPTSGSEFIINFLDYSKTDKHKMALARSSNTSSSLAGTGTTVIRWANLAAVTSISFRYQSTASYGVGSSFSLYGLVA